MNHIHETAQDLPAKTSHEIVAELVALFASDQPGDKKLEKLKTLLTDAEEYLAERNEEKLKYLFLWESSDGDFKAKLFGSNKELGEVIFNMMVADPKGALRDSILLAAVGFVEHHGNKELAEKLCHLIIKLQTQQNDAGTIQDQK